MASIPSAFSLLLHGWGCAPSKEDVDAELPPPPPKSEPGCVEAPLNQSTPRLRTRFDYEFFAFAPSDRFPVQVVHVQKSVFASSDAPREDARRLAGYVQHQMTTCGPSILALSGQRFFPTEKQNFFLVDDDFSAGLFARGDLAIALPTGEIIIRASGLMRNWREVSLDDPNCYDSIEAHEIGHHVGIQSPTLLAAIGALEEGFVEYLAAQTVKSFPPTLVGEASLDLQQIEGRSTIVELQFGTMSFSVSIFYAVSGLGEGKSWAALDIESTGERVESLHTIILSDMDLQFHNFCEEISPASAWPDWLHGGYACLFYQREGEEIDTNHANFVVMNRANAKHAYARDDDDVIAMRKLDIGPYIETWPLRRYALGEYKRDRKSWGPGYLFWDSVAKDFGAGSIEKIRNEMIATGKNLLPDQTADIIDTIARGISHEQPELTLSSVTSAIEEKLRDILKLTPEKIEALRHVPKHSFCIPY